MGQKSEAIDTGRHHHGNRGARPGDRARSQRDPAEGNGAIDTDRWPNAFKPSMGCLFLGAFRTRPDTACILRVSLSAAGRESSTANTWIRLIMQMTTTYSSVL